MLRFLPDDWFLALLRPLLLADPAYGLYLEISAPDWRFAMLAALLLLACVGRRRLALLQRNQGLLLLGLVVCFYVWTLVSGNGRYFLWGLLIVGPLVVVAARELRATRAMRNTVILGAVLLQGVVAAISFFPNGWSLLPWRTGPGLALDAAAVRERPAVFLTTSAISYSALVPQMHPQSRWANIIGQMDIGPMHREYKPLLALLESPLPMYAVKRTNRFNMDSEHQPTPPARRSLQAAMARYGFALTDGPCEYVRSATLDGPVGQARYTSDSGFWFCAVRRTGPMAPQGDNVPVAPEVNDVFDRIERHCPVFFPPGQALTARMDGAAFRWYVYSEVTLYVDDSREVYFRHSRAINPTTIGTIEGIRAGKFTLDCAHLPGRYLPPWRRD